MTFIITKLPPLKNGKLCCTNRPGEGDCPACGTNSGIFPEDYDPCPKCGFDHKYDKTSANKWHQEQERQQ